MVNRCLGGKVFFLLGLQGHRQVNMTGCYVSIREPTFPLPRELVVTAGETCSSVVAKWQIVSRGWGTVTGPACQSSRAWQLLQFASGAEVPETGSETFPFTSLVCVYHSM